MPPILQTKSSVYALRYLGAELSICADSSAQLHKLDRFFVYLAGYSNGERHLPRIFDCRHTISVLTSETVSPNAEHAVTIAVIILSIPPGDRDTTRESSAYTARLSRTDRPSSCRVRMQSTLYWALP